MIAFGELSLWVALLMAACATLAALVGGAQQRVEVVRAGEFAVVVTAGCVLAALIGLGVALVAQEYALVYVASHVSLNLPKLYRLSALWAGVSGRLLFCAAALSAASAFLLVVQRVQRRTVAPETTATLSAIVFTMLLAIVTTDDPYRRMESVAPDGLSAAPWLQSMGMVLHPPVLYIGLMCATVPFALLIGALTSGQRDTSSNDRWMDAAYRWAAWAWAMQTLALGLGMWWTYTTLGEAQRWRSTDAEVVSLVAWAANALLLLGTFVFERRAWWRMWQVALIIAMFDAAMCSVLLLRDAQALTLASAVQSAVGQWMVWSLTGATLMAVYLVSTVQQGAARAGVAVPSVERHATRTSTRMLPRSTRYGAALSVCGGVLLAVALVAQRFQHREAATITTGETVTMADAFGATWTFTSQGISTFVEPNHHVAALALMAQHDGRRVGLVSSEKRQFVDARGEPTFDPWTQAGILAQPLQDVYVAIDDARDNNTATMRVVFVPFASWVWLGLLVVASGSIMMMWPPAAPAVGIAPALAEYHSLSKRPVMTVNDPHTNTTSLDPVEAAIAKARAAQRECASCGPRPEPHADYCSTCGRFLASDCPSCGAHVNESGARFCSACGVQLVTT